MKKYLVTMKNSVTGAISNKKIIVVGDRYWFSADNNSINIKKNDKNVYHIRIENFVSLQEIKEEVKEIEEISSLENKN